LSLYRTVEATCDRPRKHRVYILGYQLVICKQFFVDKTSESWSQIKRWDDLVVVSFFGVKQKSMII